MLSRTDTSVVWTSEPGFRVAGPCRLSRPLPHADPRWPPASPGPAARALGPINPKVPRPLTRPLPAREGLAAASSPGRGGASSASPAAGCPRRAGCPDRGHGRGLVQPRSPGSPGRRVLGAGPSHPGAPDEPSGGREARQRRSSAGVRESGLRTAAGGGTQSRGAGPAGGLLAAARRCFAYS